jgi:hypothetical protein
MVLLTVFFASLSSLAVEVLLTRVFSFAQWNHLSFMVISIVLFGFGASGSILTLIEGRRPGWIRAFHEQGGNAYLILLFSLSAAGALLFVQAVPLDYFQMPLQPVQLLYLAATYLILLLPFLCAGGVISAAFSALPERSGWIYGASMAGSALGALLPAALLPPLGVGRAIILCAALPLGAAGIATVAAAVRARSWKAWPLRVGAVVVVLALLVALPAIQGGRLLELKPSPYKLLAQTLQFPGSRVLETVNTLRGRVDRIESPALRFAPGMSLKYQGRLPERELLIRDADGLYVQFCVEEPAAGSAPKRDSPAEFVRYTHAYAAAQLTAEKGRALVLQAGGGLGLPYAAAAGFREVHLAVDHPWIAARAARLYGRRNGEARLTVSGQSIRRLLARSEDRFDLIHLEQWGPSIPGMAGLNQEHLLTVEAFRQYVEHLDDNGVLVLSRRLLLPPSDSLRLFSAAFRALAESGRPEPERHLAIVHGFDSFSLLVSAAPLDSARIATLREFCSALNFDLLYYAGISPEETGRFNRFEEPFHFRELQGLAKALAQKQGTEYYSRYLLDVSPATDDRPFHNRFTKIFRIGDLYRATGSRFYLLLMSGETVVLAVLAIALVIGFALLAVPRAVLGRRTGPPSGEAGRARRRPRLQQPLPQPQGPARAPRRSPRLLLYFLATGAGFMLVEMAFIQRYTLLFGDPVVAFTVVLAGLLVASGLGAAVSARWGPVGLSRSLALMLPLLAGWALWGDRLVRRLLVAAPSLEWGAAVLLLLLFGFLLGIPFPTALRCYVRGAGMRSYLWAANGIASVVASILALPVAMIWGISWVLWLAGACYAVSLVLSRFVRIGKVA